MRLTIVTTMYRSEGFIEEFVERAAKAAEPLADEVEFVLVDDGCPGGSQAVARRLLGGRHNTKLVTLARNYGHHPAMLEGLRHADGDRVFLIDCDLEEPPEVLAEFGSVMDAAPAEDPIDVVYGVQRTRKGGAWERLSGAFFYWLMNKLSDLKIPRSNTVARLMTRRYVAALLRHRETEMFALGLMVAAGHRQVGVPIDKASRPSSNYSFTRKLTMTAKAVASFSDRPLIWMFIGGCVVTVLTSVVIAALLVSLIAFDQDYLSGWPSLLAAIAFFGGATLAGLGVIGFYLGRVMMQVKERPVIVRDVLVSSKQTAVHPEPVSLDAERGPEIILESPT